MTEEFFEAPQKTRQAMAGDPHRPVYHFLPPRNWMNDPNGLVHWQGKTHLFYQFNPYRPHWGFIHWGHASSPDLIHWEDHPLALTPEADSGDANGCFSGCVVVDSEGPAALYTGFVSFVETPVLLARGAGTELNNWVKSPHNPVIPERPAGVNETDFRDPYVWREDDLWKMVIGAGLPGGVSAALLYESSDLMQWTYLGVLYQDAWPSSVSMWECPNFFQLDGYHVLLVSLFPNMQGVYYYVGDYDGQTFHPRQQGFLDTGPFFYAPQVRQLDGGRLLLFAWLLEGRDDEAIDAAGWAGVQAIPRVLRLDSGLRLVSQPVPEAAVLRRDLLVREDVHLDAGEGMTLPVAGRQLEIRAEITTGGEGVLRLHVCASPDESEMTVIGCNIESRECFLDTTQASLSSAQKKTRQSFLLPDDPGDTLKIRVLIDSSVIEVWFGDGFSITGRVYPTRQDARQIRVVAQGSQVQLPEIKVWTMAGIWPVEEEDAD